MFPETTQGPATVVARGPESIALDPFGIATRVDRVAVAPAAAFLGVALLALAAPFETTQPLVRLPGQTISNVEVALAAAFAVWAAAIAWTRQWPAWRTPLTGPWLAWLATMIVAAAAAPGAPGARMNALHMAGRMTAAFGIFLLAVNATPTAMRLRTALALSMAAAVAVSLLAILEYLQVHAVLRALTAFRPGVFVVGAQLRAGGPLQYPTIASMYLEIAFAFGLGLLLWAFDARDTWRRTLTAVLFAALLIVAEAIIVTFTRAGLMTMAASVALVGVTRRRQRGSEAGSLVIAALALAVAGLFVASRSAQATWLRLTSEGQEAWYRASITAPAEIAFTTGTIADVPVTVTNTGRLQWDSRADSPFFLSYHVLQDRQGVPAAQAGADRVVAFEGPRTAFPGAVAPGAAVSVQARVRAPGAPGRYRLVWDVVQEGRLWFNFEPGATPTESLAIVSGAPAGTPVLTTAAPRTAERPGRMVLWRAAARMIAAHPILGVGPDNFRLLYDRYAGLTSADARIHSNNMYLEILVGSGLAGGLAFAWLLWCAAGCAVRALGAAVDRPQAAALGVAAAVLAIALHGLVDSFLSFTPTYVLFALALGFVAAVARGAESDSDAHRV